MHVPMTESVGRRLSREHRDPRANGFRNSAEIGEVVRAALDRTHPGRYSGKWFVDQVSLIDLEPFVSREMSINRLVQHRGQTSICPCMDDANLSDVLAHRRSKEGDLPYSFPGSPVTDERTIFP